MEGKSPKSSPEPSHADVSTTRSSPHLTPPTRNSPNAVPPAVSNQAMDDMSWGTLNATAGNMNFVEPDQAYTNIANTAPSCAFPPNPSSCQQPQQMTRLPMLGDMPFPSYPSSFPSQSSIGSYDMFSAPFVPPQLTEWSSVIPNLANFGGGAMTTEAMVTNPGISHAAERASDINLAALLPSYGFTSAGAGMPCTIPRHPSVSQPMAPSFTSGQQHAYPSRNTFDETFRAILTTP